MKYTELYQAIQDYSENTEPLFVNNIPRFVREAEDRIYNSVQIPSLRRNVTGTLTAGNQYLSAPNDYLATYSIAVIDNSGNYVYLLNKDVNFLREAYPSAVFVAPTYQGTPQGTPKYYALFGAQYSNDNELSFMLAPTPDDNYNVELHYFYYPVSIVQGALSGTGTFIGGSLYTNGSYANVPFSYVSGITGNGAGATANVVVSGGQVTSVTIQNGGNFYIVGNQLTINSSYIGGTGSGFVYTVGAIDNPSGTSWLGDNYDPVLLYGAMREAILFMKGEQDMVSYYEKMYQDAIGQLKRLGDGLERNDAYRKGQTSLPYNQL
jgi:hypothetical protein